MSYERAYLRLSKWLYGQCNDGLLSSQISNERSYAMIGRKLYIAAGTEQQYALTLNMPGNVSK